MCDLAASLTEQGHRVLLLTDAPDTRPADVGGAEVRVLELPGVPSAWADAARETARHNLMHAAAAYREVRRLHGNEPLDAVLAPLWRSEGALCALDGRFPTIVTCMTSLLTLGEIDPAYPALAGFRTMLALEREALHRSEYLHGLTDAVIEKTIDDHGLEPRVRTVIGRGVRDRRRTDGAPARGSRIPRVLFVGRIEPRKGVDLLLLAAERLLGEGVEVRVTIAGRPAEGPVQEAFARRSEGRPELARAVHFAGNVDDEELDRLYGEADVVCVPSRYESHGIVLLEAMMHGRAIVTCSAGGIGEVVEPGVTALVAPPDDPEALAEQLGAVLADPELCLRMGQAGREAYEQRFDARLVARRMAAFMAELAEGHRPTECTDEEIGDRLAELLCDAELAEAPDAEVWAGELLTGRPGGRPSVSGTARPRAAVLDRQGVETRELLERHALARLPSPREGGESNVPRVSAVVLARERPEFLCRALDSIEAQAVPCQALVIDDGSDPGMARMFAAECEARGTVALHRVEVNSGISAGRNLGVEMTDGELVLFLDDDAELMPGALAHMLGVLEEDPRAEAVTATVVTPDGLISHSGGSFERSAGVVNFALGGFGEPFGMADGQSGGPVDWIGGTAYLARRTLLEEFPFDPGMGAYYEDNEWCYRVSLGRPGGLRRSPEALALHQLAGRRAGAPEAFDVKRMIRHLAACARFYELHGLLLGPFSWDLLPDRVAADGDLGLGDIRLLMELITAKGTEWTLEAWNAGELENLLQANKRREQLERTHPELELFRTEVPRLNKLANEQHRALLEQPQILNWLYEREETLRRIEAGGWWRLRGLAQGPLRALQGLRKQLRRRRG